MLSLSLVVWNTAQASFYNIFYSFALCACVCFGICIPQCCGDERTACRVSLFSRHVGPKDETQDPRQQVPFRADLAHGHQDFWSLTDCESMAIPPCNWFSLSNGVVQLLLIPISFLFLQSLTIPLSLSSYKFSFLQLTYFEDTHIWETMWGFLNLILLPTEERMPVYKLMDSVTKIWSYYYFSRPLHDDEPDHTGTGDWYNNNRL